MADSETWSERLREWRASGLTAAEYCAGREFAATGLYWWSSKLGKTAAGTRRADSVRLARVVRAPGSATVAEPEAINDLPLVMIELEGARVFASPGVDRATLEAVFGALSSSTQRADR